MLYAALDAVNSTPSVANVSRIQDEAARIPDQSSTMQSISTVAPLGRAAT
jgi:hypothetical protein